jgi:hypothetical protein
MIQRVAQAVLRDYARGYQVIGVTGPRQSGKTTLVRATFPRKPYVSLETPDQLEYAAQDPRGFLSRFPDGAVLDEVQRSPALFSYIQTRVDEDKRPGQFILTGSQQFGLLSRITQTLAGRIGLVQLLPFSLAELSKVLHFKNMQEILYKGLYPPLYDRKLKPDTWYANYVMTYVERDVRQVVNVRELNTFQRFIRMCAARCGQLLNLSGLASDCGITHNTAKAWISVLEASYIVFLLYPHYRNFGKRLIKAPKLYFYDSGLAAWLLGIQDAAHLSMHPSKGPLFEGFVISELLKARFNKGLPSNLYFWRDSAGNEIDVIVEQGETLIPIEIKAGQTVTSDAIAGLEKWHVLASQPEVPAFLVYGGTEKQERKGIAIRSWRDLKELKDGL